MTSDIFDRVIAETLRELPRAIHEKLKQVAIVVEDRPPRGKEADLLGLFLGVPYKEKIGNPHAGSDRIILFRRNLEASCQGDRELAAEIRVTLIHEIGHYLGLNEEELTDRGLE